MVINVTGKNFTVSGAVNDRIEKKFLRLERHFERDAEVNVRLSVEKQRNIAEFTIKVPGNIIRSQESTIGNMFSAIDAAFDKLERQLKKYKSRFEKKPGDSTIKLAENEFTQDVDDSGEETEAAIVREKRYELKPITPQEAIAQMELIGHTFFMFLNQETDSVCVVYQRNDGGYGMLIPD